MSFDPVEASKNIVEKYIRYLSTIFEISDKNYADQFKKELNNRQTFAKGPFLDVTDPFTKGKSISELIDCGVLPKSFERIKVPLTRPLYYHQEKAINRVINGRNIVVSTGTGSGKTESFLIPVLSHIIHEDEANRLGPGIRALIIYPMNALANDQIERLRALLAEYPHITYGSYTGQTKEEYNDALAEYKSLNNGKIPAVNELICRKQMKAAPPHIFITNYAMLEYLMLRPDDSVFFSPEYADKWKFIILDEAHVYNGSTGIEVSMLLRRLKAKLENNKIQYILTSATLGGEDENDAVAQFAQNLCDCSFSEKDVIRASRIKPTASHEKKSLSNAFYDNIAGLLDNNTEENSILEQINKEFGFPQISAPLEEVLYNIVLHDNNYWLIREYLFGKPATVSSLAKLMGWSNNQIANFVAVASKCEKNGDKLFDARYHIFIRATESVFITLHPSNKLFFTRKEFHLEHDNNNYRVFEIATCEYCHAVYLVGKVENGYLVQASGVLEPSQRNIFLLGENISDTDEEHTFEDEQIEANMYEICSRCGFLHKTGSPESSRCDHGKNYYVNVIRVTVRNTDGKLTKCVSCENTNNYGVLRMFFAGQEAVTSVIGTALFEALPSYKVIHEVKHDHDDSGFGVATPCMQSQMSREAKQFIAFSDSRQAAAFYASYFDQTYRNILYKRLIVETLKMRQKGSSAKTASSFIEDLIYQFEKHGVASSDADYTRKEAWKALLHEIVDNNGSTSLYSMGLIGLGISEKNMLPNKNYNLSDKEVATLCSVLAMGMMADAAIWYDVPLNRADKEYFTHNGVEFSYTLSDGNPKAYRRSFIPTKANMKNKRLDYLVRVLDKKGISINNEKANMLLTGLWNRIFIPNGIIRPIDGKYRLDIDKVMISRPDKWYICSKCKKVTIHNINNVCPSYQCEGELIQIDLDAKYKGNHYYELYQTLDIRELRIVEHTAQLDKETAYNYQKKFQRKEIDVLSCSTTFEMGVDVGTLETVFMRNMPPSPANYAQRAGRAGRSKHAAAYALTFCNKSNHDFSFFNSPEKMIRGKINPPKFNVENDKIAIRHLYASTFSFFWKKYPYFFSNASDMAEKNNNNISGYDCLRQYLSEQPSDLKEFCMRFLPVALSGKFGVSDFRWIPGLINDDENNPGVLSKALAEYNYEVSVLKDAIERAIKAESSRLGYLMARKRVYEKEEILGFLSRKSVLPKYGFPVDTVEMAITDKTGKSKLGLQLQRDLQMAISEYAPGSQIVANGNLITSRYIRKIPNMSWKMSDYIICDNCNTLNIKPHVEKDEFSELLSCCQCHNVFNPSKRKTFLLPAFGFEADGDKIEKPGLMKPERTYRSEIAYVGNKGQEPIHYQIGKAEIELMLSLSDEMAVLNESHFYVCESCGYTDLDDDYHMRTKRLKHKTANGYDCWNDGTNRLRLFSLGYRFETDVIQLRFLNPDIVERDVALSVLYAILKGVCNYLYIEQNDISGCLQYYYNQITCRPNFAIILYDKTPGGAGHVRRLNKEDIIQGVLKESLRLIEQCTCGGENKDSSCYTCLRSYYNQKYHDILRRKHVIGFLKEII